LIEHLSIAMQGWQERAWSSVSLFSFASHIFVDYLGYDTSHSGRTSSLR